MIKNNDNERREYFRIDDEIFLTFNTITEDEFDKAPEILGNLAESSFRLSTEFATLNNSIHPLLNNIKQLHPDIGEYLEFLNQKIDSLNQLMLLKETDFDEDSVITANLSASGISFNTNEDIDKNQPVKLEVVLLPEKIGILVFGRVVNSELCEDKTCNHVSIKFEHIRPEDRELMIKHNLNKQMSDLRVQKDNN